MSTYIDSNMEQIGEFLNNVKALSVPANQRDFAWTDAEIQQFWADITEALDDEGTQGRVEGELVLTGGHGFLRSLGILGGSDPRGQPSLVQDGLQLVPRGRFMGMAEHAAVLGGKFFSRTGRTNIAFCIGIPSAFSMI